MSERQTETRRSDQATHGINPWRLAGWIAVALLVGSLVASAMMAAANADGLTAIKLTALNEADEPRDHKLPLVKQKEALPDYTITVKLKDGSAIHTKTKNDRSAVDGLSWQFEEPIQVTKIASILLEETDKLLTDHVFEAQFNGESIVTKGYQLEFTTAETFAVGFDAFFETPVGKAISIVFVIAGLLLVAAVMQ